MGNAGKKYPEAVVHKEVFSICKDPGPWDQALELQRRLGSFFPALSQEEFHRTLPFPQMGGVTPQNPWPFGKLTVLSKAEGQNVPFR